MATVHLDHVADELYALTPEDFVARRDARAREARAEDRGVAATIAALKRPTTAAWLVNMLVRHRLTQVEQLLDLGEALRTAQASMSGDELRTLSEQRRRLVAAVAKEARRLAFALQHPVSAAVEAEVAQTLDAALADDAAADAVRSGRLTKGLTYAGLGAASAATPTGTTHPLADRPSKLRTVAAPDPAAAARQQVDHAQQVLDETASRRRDAESDVQGAESTAAAARERVDRLHEELADAQRAAAEAADAVLTAQRRLRAATKAEQTAEEQLGTARKRLERARRDPPEEGRRKGRSAR
jgi:chromosome segregation ATPase